MEVLFDIVEGSDERYEFDFPHMRTTQDLLLAAILLADWKGCDVVFLTATSYYSLQAVRFARRYEARGVAGLSHLTIGVAGNIPQATLRSARVIFHHGREYPLPPGLKCRTVIQHFKGEDVPHDTRPMSSLMY